MESYPEVIAAWDPGRSGAIAMLFPSGRVLTHKNPNTAEALCVLLRRHDVRRVICERQVGAGGFRTSGPSMFSLGCHYGTYLTVFRAIGIQVHVVTAQAWQGTIDMHRPPRRKKGDPQRSEKEKSDAYRDRKRALCEAAKKVYPTLTVTLTNCDALLLLAYAKTNDIRKIATADPAIYRGV